TLTPRRCRAISTKSVGSCVYVCQHAKPAVFSKSAQSWEPKNTESKRASMPLHASWGLRICRSKSLPEKRDIGTSAHSQNTFSSNFTCARLILGGSGMEGTLQHNRRVANLKTRLPKSYCRGALGRREQTFRSKS